jgi:hypothetical protein
VVTREQASRNCPSNLPIMVSPCGVEAALQGAQKYNETDSIEIRAG